MKNLFGLLLCLGAGLVLFSARSSGPVCADCTSDSSVSDLIALWSDSAKMKLPYPAPPKSEAWSQLKPDERLTDAKARLLVPLKKELAKKNLVLGTPSFIRVFKETRELELWLKADNQWKLFRTYPIAAMSGRLGPKCKEGDRQAPEGFYSVNQLSLNPGSTFHLSFNIGYPNAYDRYHGGTGSFIMVHGNEVSIGCFAMTDPVIEEIYLIVEASLMGGQAEVPVHSFPFRMTPERLAQTEDLKLRTFWQQLKPAYDAFESKKTIPSIGISIDGQYIVEH